MITLKEACKKVLAAHPNEYIWVVNEYEKAYQFAMLNNDETVGPYTFFGITPGVIKKEGWLDNELSAADPIFNGDYKQYDKEYIENLLKEKD